MKKKPDHFIILIKKEYSEFNALYESDNIAETTRPQTNHNETTTMAPQTTLASKPTNTIAQTTNIATTEILNTTDLDTSTVTEPNDILTEPVSVTEPADITKPVDEAIIVDIFSGESSADHSGDNWVVTVVTPQSTTLSTPETSLEIVTQRQETTFIPDSSTGQPIDETIFDDTPVIIVEPLQTFESSAEVESSVNFNDDSMCNCDHSILQMISSPKSLLMNTLTKIIRQQVEDELRDQMNQQLVEYKHLVGSFFCTCYQSKM